MSARPSWFARAVQALRGAPPESPFAGMLAEAATRTATPPRTQRRSYAGAQYGRTVSDWLAQSTSADSELFTSLRTLRNRTRQMVRDNEYASHAISRVIPNNVIGQGIGFQAQVMMRRGGKLDEKINTLIEACWAHWTKASRCHTAGKMSFQDLERCIIRSVAESGEILVRKVKRRFADSQVPLALELIEADQLVDNWSGRSHNGNEIRMGVEVDEWQRPVAYWLYPRHPGDYAFASTAPSNDWQRVPADEILHIGLFDRPNQTRCVPWLHSALIKLRHIGGTEEAEIVTARANASVMGFITSPEADDGTGAVTDADGVQDGEQVMDMAPGLIKKLSSGEQFTGFNPSRPNAGLESFLRHLLRSVAAGTGISYESLTRDYSQSNYSSSRLALLDDRDQYRVLQAWIIRTFHQHVFEAWLELAVLANVLPLPAYESTPEIYHNVRWMPRGWAWVDPAKEVAAAKAAVRAGFKTVADVIAETGGDIEDVFRNRRRELDLAAEYDLVLDSDPAQVNDKGIVQPLSPVEETNTGLDGDGNPIEGGAGPKQGDASSSDAASGGSDGSDNQENQ